MKKTFFSFAFGCRVNTAEKEEIDQKLLHAGFGFSRSEPSVCLINTCAVTAKAEREARQYLYQLRRKFPKTKLVVTGCSATLWKNQAGPTGKIPAKLPIDFAINNVDKQYLVDLLLKRYFTPNSAKHLIKTGVSQASKFLESGRAMIKIQDGCQRFCSYCIVPYLRGLPKSFLIKDIVAKINSLKKVQEVILTAINTEAFGFDTGESLTNLIDRVLEKTSAPRISFGSIHPWSIDQKFLDYYKKVLKKRRLANFFHVPLQSGSDKILRLMKRGYTTKEFSWKVREIKKINPFAQVAIDVIVGFLDESDRDFETTYRFLEENPIDKFHVFRFSPRDKTAAWYMKKRLPEALSSVKIKRARALADLGHKKYQQFLQKLVDAKYQSQALFLDRFKECYQQSLLDNQVSAWVKTKKNKIKQIRDVRCLYLKNNLLLSEDQPVV